MAQGALPLFNDFIFPFFQTAVSCVETVRPSSLHKRPRGHLTTNVPKFKVKSSQIKLLITNNLFCIVQKATAQSKTGIFRDYGVAEAPPGF
jgi:hypothetical protein